MLDIRTGKVEKIDRIRFADNDVKPEVANILLLEQGVYLSTTLDDTLEISSATDAENLIKALQYAIDNNWFEEVSE